MAVTFHIPGPLLPLTGGQGTVVLDASPATVGEALSALTSSYPGVASRVMTEEGRVRPHVNVFVGRESIRFTGGLETPLHEGDEISIIPAVSGGRQGPTIRDRRRRPATAIACKGESRTPETPAPPSVPVSSTRWGRTSGGLRCSPR